MQYGESRVAGALDCDDGIPGVGRAGLCVLDAATVSPWRAQKGSGERARVAANAKRCRRRTDRGAHFAHGFATPLEGRLSEDGPRFGVEDRAAYNSGAINRR